MMYYNMTNKELLDAYNASAEYDESMCCEICTRVGTMSLLQILLVTFMYQKFGTNRGGTLSQSVSPLVRLLMKV